MSQMTAYRHQHFYTFRNHINHIISERPWQKPVLTVARVDSNGSPSTFNGAQNVLQLCFDVRTGWQQPLHLFPCVWTLGLFTSRGGMDLMHTHGRQGMTCKATKLTTKKTFGRGYQFKCSLAFSISQSH
jgi:hypothetical protein